MLIAVLGGSGTFAEIAFAHFGGVPVVFVDSFPQFNIKLGLLGRLNEIHKFVGNAQQEYPTINGHRLNPPTIVTGLQMLFSTSNLVIPRTGNPQQDATDAVNKALAQVHFSALPVFSKFPGIKSYPNSGQEFDRLLTVVDT